ncbi:dipeptide ABC transporter ATP-binding protein [Ochrobactrum teleogrylli]|uniref:ABC transporter ATP-binding protein n=1 Tax=Ochrobactrum teleogrylli TaxID=2479765 RepID=A0ABY2Y144_9HYPH|nr:ABC transporter ATP-binding protein [[Ochrobactrum] teleogrylli]TNV10087.1 ABC transporter ATP-binding protein [[Ochrobactrum] teleogrylli]
MSLLEVEQVSVKLANAKGEFTVLDSLSFTLQRGKVLGLVGESGAGKSMIGRTIAQLLPDGFAAGGGKLHFDGRDMLALSDAERRHLLGRDIAFIPQEPLAALNPSLTIGQQIREHMAHIAAAPRRSSTANWRTDAVEALEGVHLHDPSGVLEKYPHQLSGGMCQRVLIAMAFLSKPKLLIADEPTTALDVSVQARIVALIREMQARYGTAVIFITHDLRLARDICDDVLVLYAGKQVEAGTACQIFDSPAHPYTRALQLAIPPTASERRGLFILPDRMPGLMSLGEITGCSFASRCPVAQPRCSIQRPPAVEVCIGHKSNCFEPETTSAIEAPPPPQHHKRDASAVPLLSAREISRAYVTKSRLFQKAEVFQAVKSASFDLAAGEFLGVVGESGSGKSTLARLLAGLEKTSGGHMTLLDRDVSGSDRATTAFRRSHIQMVFQDPQSALNPRRRVGEIVTQAMEVMNSSAADRASRAAELLSEIGLSPEMAHRYPSQMSGGQKQRVNIARALCTVPRLLIADEIVSGLDVSVQAQLLELLRRLRTERALSIILISHDLSVVRYLCDRVLVLYRGEVVESGDVDSVFASPQAEYTRTLLAAMPGERQVTETTKTSFPLAVGTA